MERWLPVVGHEGAYEVSDLGRVRSLDRVERYERIDQYSGRIITVCRQHKGRLLRPGPNDSGHLTVVLGRGNTRQVHALVLEAFVGPCPDGHECCHGDDVPFHNALDNLRWGTRSDNLHDAVRNGGKLIGDLAPRSKLRARDIPTIRAATGRGCIAKLARDLGVNEATIRQVRYGKSWKHVGGDIAHSPG